MAPKSRESDCCKARLLTTTGGTARLASLDGERLITPPLGDRVLDSITRAVLLKTGLVEEESISVDQIPQIKEAFLASTLREVHPVSAIDDHQIEAPGPLSAAVEKVLRATIAEAVGQPA